MNEIEATEVIDRDNLAVVMTVEALEPIPNKDRIELVRLKDCGYTTICEKGHKVGDLVVFVKYDTVLPQNELFEFMRETKFRVKAKSFTIRDENDEVVDKIYSQGIVLPLQKIKDSVKEWNGTEWMFDNKSVEGCDWTEILGVKKYIPPVKGSGTSFGNMCSKGDFPTHIVSKTDETNLASKTKALEEIKGLPVYITQKIEGSSITIMWDDENNELMVCSRNNQIGEHETNKFWQAVNRYNLKETMNKDIIIQAELAGPGIQKNKLGLNEVDMYVFNIIDKRNRKLLTMDGIYNICGVMGLKMVPIVCELPSFDWSFDRLQRFSDLQKYENGEIAEGIVVRPQTPFFSKANQNFWSFKIIGRDYKL